MKKILVLAALMSAMAVSNFALVPETDEKPVIDQIEQVEEVTEEAPAE
ncbi:hypothetical protein HOD08_00325 [bacterium]|mgnify:CR=1 FL=1|jgi:hypothetical protein|nr:hypothetical protein [bacterium]